MARKQYSWVMLEHRKITDPKHQWFGEWESYDLDYHDKFPGFGSEEGDVKFIPELWLAFLDSEGDTTNRYYAQVNEGMKLDDFFSDGDGETDYEVPDRFHKEVEMAKKRVK